MRIYSHVLLVVAMIGLGLFGASDAVAAPLPCDAVTSTECQITSVKDLGPGGVYTVDRTLHLGLNGHIKTDPGSLLTLGISGDLIMDIGAKITADTTLAGNKAGRIVIIAGGAILLDGNGTNGAIITADQVIGSCISGAEAGVVKITSNLQSPDASIVTRAGSRISTNARCPAGKIKITAANGGVDIRGVVESVSQLTGIGLIQPPGGGPIHIFASCNLTVSDTGRVSSRGLDPGADLVHLEAGGHVTIQGLVESTGPGHVPPNSPANSCQGALRPDKPLFSTACVEVWAGKTIVIDRTGTKKGEINADVPQGGPTGIGWIDLYAKGDIEIKGPGAGPYAANATPYAVHSNQIVTNAQGGLITIKSIDGHVRPTGQAIQADATTTGGAGGTVTIEAGGILSSNVKLSTSSVRARGANTGGGPQAGGQIFLRAYNGRVGGASPGELNATGGAGKPVPQLGIITMQGCDVEPPAVLYTGTTTPTPPTILPVACGGTPTVPAYVIFPSSACDPCVGPDCPCEGPDCPCEGPDCPCEGPDCPCLGALGPDGLNPNCPYVHFCPLGSVQATMDPVSGRFSGNVGPDVTVDVRTQSLQSALDTVSDVNNDGYIIVAVIGADSGFPGGEGTQQFSVNRVYDKPFALVGCGVTLRDPVACDGIPTAEVTTAATSPEHPVGSEITIFIQGLTLTGSTSAVGWFLQGDGRMLVDIGAHTNARIGIHMIGIRNVLQNVTVRDNVGGGLLIEGRRNTVDTVSAQDNPAGDGIRIVGRNNTIINSKAGDLLLGTGNGENGFVVSGTGNLIQGNSAFDNGGNGFTISGGTALNPNIVSNNVAGAPNRGNAGSGFSINGQGAGASGVVDIVGNTAQSNSVNGIGVSGADHRLQNNASGGTGNEVNLSCQYNVATGNFNATGNTRNGVAIAGADGSPFPNGCQ